MNFISRFSENTGKFQLAEKKMLADDQWHHIAVVMPFNSCRYSEVQLYIDGVLCKTQQTHGSDNHMFFHTSGKLNIGGYGYRKDFDNDDGLLHMFEGAVDDVMVWSKPLQKQDILRLWDDEHQCEGYTECCGSCLNGKCEGESESRPQDQGVQSLNNGLDAPILTGGPLSSNLDRNIFFKESRQTSRTTLQKGAQRGREGWLKAFRCQAQASCSNFLSYHNNFSS